MAIYHLTTKPISRSSGRSATASAAYRAGCEITDTRTGLTFDYSKKKGVLFSRAFDKDYNEIDRNELWNLAEQSENRKDSRTAREYIIAIPHELMTDKNKNGGYLAVLFAKKLAEKYNIAVDVAIHAPDKNGDDKNYHAHIMTTTRKIVYSKHGLYLHNKADIELSNKKLKELDKPKSQDQIKQIRKLWADLANSHLSNDNQIDHRSFAEREIDIAPTVKLGWRASALERQGIKTDRGDINRQIKLDNEQIIFAKKEIGDLIDERINICKRIASDSEQRVNDSKQRVRKRIDKIGRNERTIKHLGQATSSCTRSYGEIEKSKLIIEQSVESANRYSQHIKDQQIKEQQIKENIILSRTAFHLINVRAKLSTTDMRTNYKDPNLNGDMRIGESLHRAIDLFKADTHRVNIDHGNNSHLNKNSTAQRIKEFMFENISNKDIALDYNNATISDFMSKYNIQYNIDDLRSLHDTQKMEKCELDDNPALKVAVVAASPPKLHQQQQTQPKQEQQQANDYDSPSM